MSDTNNEQTSQSSVNDAETNSIPSELETLQARLDLMGVEYHHRAGVDKLRKLIEDAGNPDKPTDDSNDSVVEAKPEGAVDAPEYTGTMLTEAEFKQVQDRARGVCSYYACLSTSSSWAPFFDQIYPKKSVRSTDRVG